MPIPLPRLVALAGLSIGALSVPPLEVIQRLDRMLYDEWTRLGVPTGPADFVLLELDDPVRQPSAIETARWQHAALFLTTLPEAPVVPSGDVPLIGPIAVASAEMPILRATGWVDGGYWWPRPDFDGVLRFDRPVLGDAAGTESLPLAAARRLRALSADELEPGAAALSERSLKTDPFGRRWLRFYDPESLRAVPSESIRRNPDALTGKIVVVGTAHAPRVTTPVGQLTTAELVAHALAGYRDDRAIETTIWHAAAGWLGAAAWIGVAAVLPLAGYTAALVALAGAASLIGLGAAAFIAASVWVPVAGPAMLVGALAGLALRRRVPAGDSQIAEDTPRTLFDGRRLVAEGEYAQAWQVFRELPMSSELIAETYALGCALAEQGEQQLAADAFHRVAQADASYRDVASRLVACCAYPLADDDRPQPSTLGRYEVLGVIGSGAMGVVYLGRDPTINRIVAIKAINLEKEFEAGYVDEARDRFVREAEIAGRLAHPSIVTVFDMGEQDGIAYIAMEYFRGTRLSEFAKPDALLPFRQALDLAARAADALDYAHHQNVVHRDIKPANIMYDAATNSLKITDFGVARLMDVSRTRTGVILGTPSYMSPEQLQGENVNGHTDLFALGVSLYQLLTGHLPFRGTSMTELMFVISNEPHIPVTGIKAELPHALDALLGQALAKDAGDRFSDGAAMARELRAVLASC